MEYHAEHPTCHAEVREDDIVFSQRIGGRNRVCKFLQAVLVREEIEEREEDAEGLLHAQKAIEGPFAVELDDFFDCSDTDVGYDVLTSVVAFSGTVPEEELV